MPTCFKLCKTRTHTVETHVDRSNYVKDICQAEVSTVVAEARAALSSSATRAQAQTVNVEIIAEQSIQQASKSIPRNKI